ncbi:MAG: amino acid ABC transporter permease [Clostridia bacterium]|nr:amino acid ABC transporter permease [Clostridia bacterium]
MNNFDFDIVISRLPILLNATLKTIELTLMAIFLGTIIGLFVALIKISQKKPLVLIGTMYTWIFRGMPLLVQLFIIYYGLPSIGIEFTAHQAAVMGLSLCGGAYIAEIIRAGIQSIDKGQMEAAYSLGMSWQQAMFRVIIPQSFKRLIPPMGNEFITLLKDTSLVAVISMVELLRAAQTQASATFKPFEMYMTAGVIYLLLTTIFTIIFKKIEERLALSE